MRGVTYDHLRCVWQKSRLSEPVEVPLLEEAIREELRGASQRRAARLDSLMLAVRTGG